jgi:hypothetical protein
MYDDDRNDFFLARFAIEVHMKKALDALLNPKWDS